MVSRAEAFCPGHITAFFEICPDPDLRRRGSRGAGLCTSLGVRTEVKVRDAARQRIRIFLDGEEEKAETTLRAVKKLIGERRLEVYVMSEVQLPVSQGFGMSGAGALSTALALNEAAKLGLSRDDVVGVAHEAEVESLTGLGDIYPQSLGGMDLRIEPGGPPHGVVRKFDVAVPLLLCVIGPPMLTKSVLHDPEKAKVISAEGHLCVEEFGKNPTLENLFVLGREFAVKTGLAGSKLIEAIDSCAPYGRASMSMLGNSVFSTGNLEILHTILRGYGTVMRCEADDRGARLV